MGTRGHMSSCYMGCHTRTTNLTMFRANCFIFTLGHILVKCLGALSVNFSSIAIELKVPCDDFTSITIELTFITLGHGFKNAGSVLSDICAPGTTKDFVELRL